MYIPSQWTSRLSLIDCSRFYEHLHAPFHTNWAKNSTATAKVTHAAKHVVLHTSSYSRAFDGGAPRVCICPSVCLVAGLCVSLSLSAHACVNVCLHFSLSGRTTVLRPSIRPSTQPFYRCRTKFSSLTTFQLNV